MAYEEMLSEACISSTRRRAMELIIPVISDKMAAPEFHQRILQVRKNQPAHRAIENYSTF
jgi:hypothetical protein